MELDAGAERGMEYSRVGRRDAIPLQGMVIGGKKLGVVEPLGCQGVPSFAPLHLGIDLRFPEDFQLFSLGIIFQAGQPGDGSVGRLFYIFNQIASGPDDGCTADVLSGQSNHATFPSFLSTADK